VLGTSAQSPYATLAIGKQQYYSGTGSTPNTYWVVVVDLTNLNVVVNEVYTDNAQVPVAVRPYIDNPQYLLIVSTLALLSGHIPQGDFYNLLRRAGAGPMLSRAEQIMEQIGTGYISSVSYILAATLNPADDKGFEELSFTSYTVMTFALMPVTVQGSTIYVPIRTES
jgi:hypothetical protein